MTSTTRRAILGAIASTPALAVSCSPQPATAQGLVCAPIVDRTEWDRKQAHRAECIRRSQEASKAVDRANAALTAATPPTDHIDWDAYPPRADRKGLLRFAVLSNPLGSDRVEAANQQIRDWRKAVGAVENQVGWVIAQDEWSDAATAWADADHDLLNTPAPDLEALAWKVEHLLEVSNDETSAWHAAYLGTTLEDVRRLLRGEA